MILSIDIGNSRIKAAVFDAGEMIFMKHFRVEEFVQELHAEMERLKLLTRLKYLGAVSVGEGEMSSFLENIKEFIPKSHWYLIDEKLPLPVKLKYKTPETLGMDRITASIGALASSGTGPVLVIDAGTALTFDFIDESNQYCGGAISPGMEMRFRALHEFTARLPKVSPENHPDLIGDSTENSIRSGVINGIIAEIDGIIKKYKEMTSGELPIYLTGGDAEFLGNHVKKVKFVDANLLLKGIHSIVQYNLANV